MTGVTDNLALVGDAIIVDEIGIEIGAYGGYRLRSSYQPIFERQGHVLCPVAVEGQVSPYLAGESVLRTDFLAGVPVDDWRFIDCLCRLLKLRNHRNIGVDSLELHVDCDPPADGGPEALIHEMGLMAEQLADVGLDPGLVICTISDAVASDVAALPQLTDAIRSRGLRIAIGDFGAGRWSEEQTGLLKPEIVRIDGEWFRKICRDATTVRLFEAVMARLREREAKVLVNGIEDHAQFSVALQAGADFFQGLHLAPSALVGSYFDETPLNLAEKLDETSKVLPLRLKHKPR